MNPDTFTGRTDEEILSTLAHEMAHVWQQTYGSRPRRSYHDREWAAKMKEIGLAPTATGAPGAKETGQSVSHYIVPEGPYAKTYTKLKATGFQLHWQSAPESKHAKAKRASKTKFTCPECGQNAWAKPEPDASWIDPWICAIDCARSPQTSRLTATKSPPWTRLKNTMRTTI